MVLTSEYDGECQKATHHETRCKMLDSTASRAPVPLPMQLCRCLMRIIVLGFVVDPAKHACS